MTTDDDDESFRSDDTESTHQQEKTTTRKINKKRRAVQDHETFRDETDPRRYSGPALNWNTLANRNWGSVSVLRYIPNNEVDRLVGWATHITSDRQAPGTDNPLLDGGQFSAPLPPSHLDYIKDKARDIVRGKKVFPISARTGKEENPFKSLVGTFDTSAAVALGKILQDMVTANLLPLAEHHVRRCRLLEQQEEMEGEDSVRRRDGQLEDCSYHEWVLPPEEAVYKIMTSMLSESQNSNSPDALQEDLNPPDNKQADPPKSDTDFCWAGTGLLSTQPPTRVMPQHVVATPKEAATAWCQRQNLEANFVRRNMEVYDLFLPCPPPEAKRKQRGGRRKQAKQTQASSASSSSENDSNDSE